MTDTDKKELKSKIDERIAQAGSLNKAANTLNGVSSAVLSNILNDKFDKVSDEMCRNIMAQISPQKREWVFAETTLSKMFSSLLSDAQLNANVYGVIAEAGSGKTATAKAYVESCRNAYLVQCNEYYNRKLFLTSLLQAMGRDSSAMTVGEMMYTIVQVLGKTTKPLIILDEADKLSDQVLYFFITLYNQLEDNCGIMLCATSHLEKRITKGVTNNRKGYSEIYSRLGRRFVSLRGNTLKDVRAVCEANQIIDNLLSTEIYNESEGDLRRVKRKVHAIKSKEQ